MIFCHMIQMMMVHISTKICTLISFRFALGLPSIIEVKYPNIVKLLKHQIFFLTACQKEVALIKDV